MKLNMKKNPQNVRPKRSAASKVQTYNVIQSAYYNEQRYLKRALKCSLIEAKAAQIKQKHLDAKKIKPPSSSLSSSSKKAKNENETKKNDISSSAPQMASTEQDTQNSRSQTSTDQLNGMKSPEVVRRFTAHRKFAQNCQPFANTSNAIDFKERTNLSTCETSVHGQSKLSTNNLLLSTNSFVAATHSNELFENTKLTTDDFLTFLCFRDYVTEPFSLAKQREQSHTDDEQSTKETRKENSSEHQNDDDDDGQKMQRETFKENKKKVKQVSVKLDKKQVHIDADRKLNSEQKQMSKMNTSQLASTGRMSHSKLSSMKSQFKNSPAKANQIKSNKLTKLAKLNKLKSMEKKTLSGLKSISSKKKLLDVKLESEACEAESSKNASSIESTIDDIIKRSIKLHSQQDKKESSTCKSLNTKLEVNSSKSNADKICSTWPSGRLSQKPKKDFVQIKPKNALKVKKEEAIETRKLRNGKFHNYQ